MSKLLQNKCYLAGDMKIIYAFSYLKYEVHSDLTFILNRTFLNPFYSGKGYSLMTSEDILELSHWVLHK